MDRSSSTGLMVLTGRDRRIVAAKQRARSALPRHIWYVVSSRHGEDDALPHRRAPAEPEGAVPEKWTAAGQLDPRGPRTLRRRPGSTEADLRGGGQRRDPRRGRERGLVAEPVAWRVVGCGAHAFEAEAHAVEALITLDTSAILALLDRREVHHSSAGATLEADPGPDPPTRPGLCRSAARDRRRVGDRLRRTQRRPGAHVRRPRLRRRRPRECDHGPSPRPPIKGDFQPVHLRSGRRRHPDGAVLRHNRRLRSCGAAGAPGRLRATEPGRGRGRPRGVTRPRHLLVVPVVLSVLGLSLAGCGALASPPPPGGGEFLSPP